VKFAFYPSKLKKQPFFANNFKIQGGLSTPPLSDAHATAQSTSDLLPKHQTSKISLKISDLMLKHQKWQHCLWIQCAVDKLPCLQFQRYLGSMM